MHSHQLFLPRDWRISGMDGSPVLSAAVCMLCLGAAPAGGAVKGLTLAVGQAESASTAGAGGWNDFAIQSPSVAAAAAAAGAVAG